MAKKVKIPKSKTKIYTGGKSAPKPDSLSKLKKSDKKLALYKKKK